MGKAKLLAAMVGMALLGSTFVGFLLAETPSAPALTGTGLSPAGVVQPEPLLPFSRFGPSRRTMRRDSNGVGDPLSYDACPPKVFSLTLVPNREYADGVAAVLKDVTLSSTVPYTPSGPRSTSKTFSRSSSEKKRWPLVGLRAIPVGSLLKVGPGPKKGVHEPGGGV